MSWSRRTAERAALLALGLAVAGCDRAPPPAPSAPPPRAAPAHGELANLAYALTAFDGVRVQLVGGRYEAPTDLPDAERLVAQCELQPLSGIGDLDGDGSADAAVVLASSGGGSGTFYELVAVLNTPRGLAPLPGVVLGDRVALQRVDVAAGVVHLEYLTAGPDDPLCCPTARARRDLRLEAGRLVDSAPAPAAL